MSLETGPDASVRPADVRAAGVDLRPARPARKPRPSRRRFWLRRTVVLMVVLAIVGGAWIGVTAVLARRSLLRAQSATAELRKDLARGDIDRARTRLVAIRRDARKARRLTSGPAWGAASAVPLAGDTTASVRGLARAADDLAARVLPHFIDVAAATRGGGLRDGDRINVEALSSMHAGLDAAMPHLERIRAGARKLPARLLLSPVAAARTTLIDEVDALARTTTDLRDVTAIAPGMLGADGPRRYFLALQTNAELRGSGGLLGAYGVIEADHGKLSLVQLGPNKGLRDTYPEPTPGLDPGFTAHYGGFGADGFWLNANMSPHFPTVSKVWTSMYERTAGVRLDGSIAVDPVALAEILKATGPAVGPDGETFSADSFVALTEQQIYARFPKHAQDPLRDALQLQITRALYERLTAPVSHDTALLPQLGAATRGGHVHIASNHPVEQRVLEHSVVGGALPAADGPYANVAINNAGGTKLDYYLRPSIDYSFETAHAGRQDVSITVKLRSEAPASGLPAYVVVRPDLPGNRALVPGQNRLHVSVYGGRGATLRGAGLDGGAVSLDSGQEQGHPVWSTFVTIDPGQERTLVLALSEPGNDQHVIVVPPATVITPKVTVHGGSAR